MIRHPCFCTLAVLGDNSNCSINTTNVQNKENDGHSNNNINDLNNDRSNRMVNPTNDKNNENYDNSNRIINTTNNNNDVVFHHGIVLICGAVLGGAMCS